VKGSHEIDAFWGDTDDVRVLKDRLRRQKAQVEKLKRDRAELRAAMKLKTEEAYQEGLLSVAPALLEVDKKVTAIANEILSGEIDGERLKVLKALLPELGKQRDRLYGKTRQRLEQSTVSASVDINELLRQKQGVLEAAGEVIDVEGVEDES
jgi:hypothetical protein